MEAVGNRSYRGGARPLRHRGTKRLAFAALCCAMVLLAARPSIADPFNDARSAYERGDYAAAVRLLRPLAEQGDASAQFNLGYVFDKSQGVTQDYAEAVKWYRKAAEQGNAASQFYLGRMYFEGQGVTQDYAEAVRWYSKSAEQGIALAQANLAGMYVDGLGVPRDYVRAHKWFNIAASRLNNSEKELHEITVKAREFVAAKMTREQIAEAQKLAREWKPKPASQ